MILFHECLSHQLETSYLGEHRPISHIFWYIQPIDVDRVIDFTCTTIKGTKNVHSMNFVGAMDVNKLFKKNLACFCYFCVDFNFSACKNLPWTQCWEVEVLILTNVVYAHSAMEIAF